MKIDDLCPVFHAAVVVLSVYDKHVQGNKRDLKRLHNFTSEIISATVGEFQKKGCFQLSANLCPQNNNSILVMSSVCRCLMPTHFLKCSQNQILTLHGSFTRLLFNESQGFQKSSDVSQPCPFSILSDLATVCVCVIKNFSIK